MEIPFWRQPLPRNSIAGGSSETEGSVASSRINIQLKLQEKKQKQLAELKIIEEEIKQGKLSRAGKIPHETCENDEGKILPRLPAPRSKKHIDIDSIDFNRRNSSCSEADNVNILLYQLQQQKNDNSIYNNFSSSSGMGIAAALTKFSHEILTNLNIGENSNINKNVTSKQPSASSTMTSTTSENENNSLTRQMVSTRKKLLHHNLSASPNRIGSPHYDPRPSAYNSLEGKNKTDTNRSSNSKNENSHGSNNNVNTSSIEKEKSLASQLIKRQMARGNTPEILLAPTHLDGNSHYFQHYISPQGPKVPLRANNNVVDASNNYMK